MGTIADARTSGPGPESTTRHSIFWDEIPAHTSTHKHLKNNGANRINNDSVVSEQRQQGSHLRRSDSIFAFSQMSMLTKFSRMLPFGAWDASFDKNGLALGSRWVLDTCSRKQALKIYYSGYTLTVRHPECTTGGEEQSLVGQPQRSLLKVDEMHGMQQECQ